MWLFFVLPALVILFTFRCVTHLYFRYSCSTLTSHFRTYLKLLLTFQLFSLFILILFFSFPVAEGWDGAINCLHFLARKETSALYNIAGRGLVFHSRRVSAFWKMFENTTNMHYATKLPLFPGCQVTSLPGRIFLHQYIFSNRSMSPASILLNQLPSNIYNIAHPTTFFHSSF